jgi:hypothetical protein
MHLIQLLLPQYDNTGEQFPEAYYTKVRRELTDKFGGLTAFTRAPAQGLWKNEGETKRDDILVFEIMSPRLNRAWWRHYRAALEERFRQDRIIIRAQRIDVV